MTRIEWTGTPPATPEIQKITVNKNEAVKVTAPKQEPLKVKVTE